MPRNDRRQALRGFGGLGWLDAPSSFGRLGLGRSVRFAGGPPSRSGVSNPRPTSPPPTTTPSAGRRSVQLPNRSKSRQRPALPARHEPPPHERGPFGLHRPLQPRIPARGSFFRHPGVKRVAVRCCLATTTVFGPPCGCRTRHPLSRRHSPSAGADTRTSSPGGEPGRCAVPPPVPEGWRSDVGARQRVLRL